MSIEATTWALGSTVGTPGDRDAATRKLVLFGYANHAHKDGRNAWAGKKTIAVYAECDKRTVIRHTKRLLREGWIREGDQSQVAHIRADRRPVVYDLAMNEATQARWTAAVAAGDSSWASEQRGDPHWSRGDNLSPRPDDLDPAAEHPRGDTTLSPRPATHGVTDGVTPNAPRGDKAVSPEPSTNPRTTPQPPASGGPALAIVCTKPGPKPHDNCRGCRTTARLLQEDARRANDARRKAEEAEAWQAERDRRVAQALPPKKTSELISNAKASMRSTP